MINRKDEFYDALWDDYCFFDQKEESFIYQYLKSRKDIRAEIISRDRFALFEYRGRKKLDKYTLLRGAYLALKNNVISEEEYTDIFRELVRTKDYLPKKYENISGEEMIDNAEKLYEQRFLIGCVSDFFYSLGYRSNAKKEHSESTKVKSKRTKEDGYIDEFEMLYEFRRRDKTIDGDEVVTNIANIDDEYIKKCTDLYRIMLNEKNRGDAFVPLFIDKNTGAGIYIIGEKRIPQPQENSKVSCFVCIISFECADKDEDYYPEEVILYYNIKEIFRSVADAFNKFRITASGEEFYEEYPYANSDKFPNGAEECFIPYFISKREEKLLNKEQKQGEEYRKKQNKVAEQIKISDKRKGIV